MLPITDFYLYFYFPIPAYSIGYLESPISSIMVADAKLGFILIGYLVILMRVKLLQSR